MAEDLLVNIEVNTKAASKNVDDLSKSFKGGARQTEQLEKILRQLEKAFRSVGNSQGLKELNSATEKSTKNIDNLGTSMKGVQKALDSTKFNSSEIDNLNKQVGLLSENIESMSKAMEENSAAAHGSSTSLIVLKTAALGLAATFLPELIEFTAVAFRGLVRSIPDVVAGLEKTEVFARKTGTTIQNMGKNFVESTKSFVRGEGFTSQAEKASEAFKKARDSMADFTRDSQRLGKMSKEVNENFKNFVNSAQKVGDVIQKRGVPAVEAYISKSSILKKNINSVKQSFETLSTESERVFSKFSSQQLKGLDSLSDAYGVKLKNSLGSATLAYADLSRETEALIRNLSSKQIPIVNQTNKVLDEALSKSLRSGSEQYSKLNEAISRATANISTSFTPTLTSSIRRVEQYQNVLSASTEQMDRFGSSIRDSVKAAEAISKSSFAGMKTTIQDLLSTGFKRLDTAFQAMKKIIADVSKSFSSVATGKILEFAEGISVTSGAFGILAALTIESENALISFVGQVSLVITVLTGGLAFALFFVIDAIGKLIFNIGTALSNAMASFEKRTAEVRDTLMSFNFTVENFSRVLGEDAVGSVSEWNAVMKTLEETTRFSMQDIQESISLMIRDGSALGLTLAEMQSTLARSADIAASSNKKLADSTLRVLSGLSGQTNGLFQLGISLKEGKLAKNEYTKALGGTFEALTDEEKVMVRLNELFRQTTPFVGAAAAAAGSLAGKTDLAAKNYDKLIVRLGEADFITQLYTEANLLLSKILAKTPLALLDSVALVQDLGGAFLQVLGLSTQVALGLSAISAGLKALNTFLQINATAQGVLTSAFVLASESIKFTAVQVTDLGSLFVNLRLASVAFVKTLVGDVFTALRNFPAIISNIFSKLAPLLAKITAFGAVTLFVLAFKEELMAILNLLPGWAQGILAIAAAYALLNTMLATNATAQAFTLKTLQKVIVLMGLTEVRVKSLSMAMMVIRHNFTRFGTVVLPKLAKTLGSVTTKITAMGKAVLFNPLFVKVALIIGAITLVIRAMGEIRKQVKFIDVLMTGASDAVKDAAGSFGFLGSTMDVLASIGVKFLNVLINITKIMISGVVTGVLLASLAISKLKLAFTSNVAEQKRLKAEIEETKSRIAEMGKVTVLAAVKITESFTATANAAEAANQKLSKIRDTVTDISTRSQNLDNAFSVDFLTNEFDKALAISNRAAQQFSKVSADSLKEFTKVFGPEVGERFKDIFNTSVLQAGIDKLKASGKEFKNLEEALTNMKKAEGDRNQAFLAVSNLRIQTTKTLSDLQKQSEIQTLKASGDTLKAIKLENSERLAQFDAQSKNLLSVTKSADARKRTIALIQQTRKALVAVNEAALSEEIKKRAADQQKAAEERLKNVQELQKAFVELQKSVLKDQGRSAELAKVNLALKEKELEELENALKTQSDFLDNTGKLKQEYTSVLDAARALAQEDFKAALPFTVGDLLSVLDEFVKSGEDMIKDMFSFDFKGTFNSLANSVKGFGSRILNADDMAGEFGKAFAEMDIAGLTANLGDSLNEAFMKVDLKTVGEGMLEGLTQGGALTMQLFDPSSIGSLSDTIQNLIVDFPKNLAEAFSKLDQVLGKVIDSLPEAMIKIVDSLPGIIQKILDKLPEFIVALAGALNKFLEQLPFLMGRILEALPDIIATLLQQLPELILNLLNAVGKIAAKLIQEIPNILVSILENLPDIIMAIVEGLIASMGDVVAAFVDFFIGGGLEKIVVALVKAVPKIAVALVNGFINGIKRALGSIFGGIDIAEPVNELATKFTEGFNSLTAKASEEASKLFKVLDLEAAAKGLDQAQRITDAINQGISNFVFQFKGLFQWLGDVWAKIVQFVKDAFNAIVKAFEDVFRWIGELFMQIVEGIRAVFQWVIDKVFTPIAELVKKAFQWVIDKILTPLGSVVKKAFEGVADIGKKLWEAFKAGFEANLDIFKKAGNAIWGALKAGFDGIGNLFGKIFDTSGAWGKGTVENALNIDIPFLKFAEGGKVPGAASVPGDSIKNDKVMAMLSPGEFVVPRSIMANPVLKKMIENIAGGQVSFLFGGGTLGKLGKGDIKGVGEDIGNAGKEAVNDLANFLGGVDPWEFIKDKVFNEMIWKMLAKNKFHDGGMVPAFANGGEVPAMLQSGEFVINRSAVNAIGAANLGRINQGQMSGGDTEYNFDIKMNIQNKGDMDEGFIRQRLIPTVKKELKNASLRGEFLISQRGIRET